MGPLQICTAYNTFVMFISRCIILLLSCHLASVTSLWTKYALVSQSADAPGSTGHVPFVKIDPQNGNGPKLNKSAYFGFSVANIGDLDGNGVEDLAVGAKGEASVMDGIEYPEAGAIYILFMNADLTVRSHVRISGGLNGGPALSANSQFGYSLTTIGDLDEDGYNEIAVGAPGSIVPSVYILFMNHSGIPKKCVLVRGKFRSISLSGNSTAQYYEPPDTGAFIPNGPPVYYLGYFGSTVAAIGDFNKDGIPDLAVTAADASGGDSKVYMLFLCQNGTVGAWTMIGDGIGGGPVYKKSFADFGSSIAVVGDLDKDGISDLAIGSKNDDDDVFSRSGAVYICFMNADGTIREYNRLSELTNPLKEWPSAISDQCGTAVVGMGDINHDDRRQQRPNLAKDADSIPDIVVGCSQGATEDAGKLMVMLLNNAGDMEDYYVFPDDDPTKKHRASNQGYLPNAGSQIGKSLTSYSDLQGTGIPGIVAGAPGDSLTRENTGAVYILFLRRLRHHKPTQCTACFYAIRLGLAATVGIVCFGSCCLFFYVFRRRPDEVEIAVKKSGLEITKKRERKRYEGKNDATVYADSYTV